MTPAAGVPARAFLGTVNLGSHVVCCPMSSYMSNMGRRFGEHAPRLGTALQLLRQPPRRLGAEMQPGYAKSCFPGGAECQGLFLPARGSVLPSLTGHHVGCGLARRIRGVWYAGCSPFATWLCRRFVARFAMMCAYGQSRLALAIFRYLQLAVRRTRLPAHRVAR